MSSGPRPTANACSCSLVALVDPGDRVVIPEPTYSLYADQVVMAGGTVDWTADATDGSLDLDSLRAKIRGRGW